MNKLEFENLLRTSYPSAQIDLNESGACTWLRLLVNERAFAIQITLNEGIGVSEVDLSLDDDFLGHDVVFQDLRQVFDFLKLSVSP